MFYQLIYIRFTNGNVLFQILFPLPEENNQIFYDLGGISPFYRLGGKKHIFAMGNLLQKEM